MSIQKELIKLEMSNGHLVPSFIKLWNYLAGKSILQICKILRRMKPSKLVFFLELMHNVCLHDNVVGYTQERLEQYQIILMCCPRLILTEFLLSLDEQCVVNLLEKCDVIWTMYFVGLIELGYNQEVNAILRDLMRLYEPWFGLNLILLLIREASNLELPHQLRQTIFDFVCQNPNMVMFIVEHENGQQAATIQDSIRQMNEWSRNFSEQYGFEGSYEWSWFEVSMEIQRRVVDAGAFVCGTFPSQHPLVPSRFYQCIICYSGPDEPNQDGTMRVFRSIPCCGNRQMVCHGCLVQCATSCNTPDHHNDFKDTSVFVCPSCRAETPFFPHEN